MALLDIRHLVYTAGQKRILDDLNLAIDAGEIHALIGTNGTGKSTLARMIMGSEGYRPAGGQLIFAGQDIASWSMQRRAKAGITLAWQEPALFEGITVGDYLSLGRSQDVAAASLELVGLDPAVYLHRMLDKTMSGGERKRIELASMWVLRAKLCILDEPVSGIDLVSIKSILAVIRRIKQQGSAILLISHREEAAEIADKASLLCGGKIVSSGQPETIIDQYKARNCLVCDGKECSHASH
ncbi:ATP-binding cassette domain-containing protein [Methylomarinum vadi]|uniref:ATP-binding cassette domain-containing protein n=1 Tax=Methylomarinum vadi TaxID=438855 RepID=UPI0004DF8EA6|nr:ABC transporter ATP-binding protein [Methylomarinum vadi]